MAIVGIGNLGRALTNSAGFASRGCQVTSLFDVDPAVVGEEIRGITVRHMDELATLRAAERPDIGVITTPGWAAQSVADLLVRAGVTSLLNFAPRVLDRPARRASALRGPLHRAAGAGLLPGPPGRSRGGAAADGDERAPAHPLGRACSPALRVGLSPVRRRPEPRTV